MCSKLLLPGEVGDGVVQSSLHFPSLYLLPQPHVHKSHDIWWHSTTILVGNTKKQSCTNLGSSFPQLE